MLVNSEILLQIADINLWFDPPLFVRPCFCALHTWRSTILFTMAQTDYKFEGWMGLGTDSADGKMVWQEFEPKPWEETDVDIKVICCGVCGTDIHTLRSGWVRFPFLD